MNTQPAQVSVDLYFAQMGQPLKIRLDMDALHDLERAGKPYRMPNGVVIYTHSERADACAVCRYPLGRPVLAPIPVPSVFDFDLFRRDELACCR